MCSALETFIVISICNRGRRLRQPCMRRSQYNLSREAYLTIAPRLPRTRGHHASPPICAASCGYIVSPTKDLWLQMCCGLLSSLVCHHDGSPRVVFRLLRCTLLFCEHGGTQRVGRLIHETADSCNMWNSLRWLSIASLWS